MRLGLLLDNCEPANSSYRKLKAMNATAVGTLWTAGTKHRRNVYEQCELMLGAPLYLVRVGGHRQTLAEWAQDARSALAEVPKVAIAEHRVLLVCGNEPDLEGYADDPEGYGALFWQVCDFSDAPVVFACPSLGKPNWPEYLTRALGGKAPAHFALNAYSLNASEAGRIRMLLPSAKMYCTEVNSRADQHGNERVAVIEWALGELGKVGVEAATGFIAGGASGGAWDEGFIFSEDEAAGLGRLSLQGGSMPDKLPECGNEFDPSPNCDDRPKPSIEGIVIHSMEGSFDAARAWFKNTASQVSAHYLLRKDGYLLQMVPEGKRAWHAGTKAADKTGLWGAADFNGISVGIELEGFAGQPFTDVQYDILRTLVWYLVKKYVIPFDRQHIVAHSELSKIKGDPGGQFRWDFLMGQQPKPANVDWQAEAARLKGIIEEAKAALAKA